MLDVFTHYIYYELFAFTILGLFDRCSLMLVPR